MSIGCLHSIFDVLDLEGRSSFIFREDVANVRSPCVRVNQASSVIHHHLLILVSLVDEKCHVHKYSERTKSHPRKYDYEECCLANDSYVVLPRYARMRRRRRIHGLDCRKQLELCSCTQRHALWILKLGCPYRGVNGAHGKEAILGISEPIAERM
jgi:hypothetical protein